MNRLFLTFMVMLLVCSAAFAQKKQNRWEQMAQRQTDIMANNMELTDEQKKDLYAVFLKYAQPISSWERFSIEEQKAMFEQRKADKDAEVKALLTEEQQETYDLMRQSAEERLKQKQEKESKEQVE